MNHYALHTETTGTGPVIVMIHGYLASSQYYKKIAKRLSVGHTVIRVDLLGHGRSPKPRAAEYGYDDHINAVRHTLTQLNIKGSFSIVGHSMGALIALRYARLYPQDVSRIVLFTIVLFCFQDFAELYGVLSKYFRVHPERPGQPSAYRMCLQYRVRQAKVACTMS